MSGASAAATPQTVPQTLTGDDWCDRGYGGGCGGHDHGRWYNDWVGYGGYNPYWNGYGGGDGHGHGHGHDHDDDWGGYGGNGHWKDWGRGGHGGGDHDDDWGGRGGHGGHDDDWGGHGGHGHW
ncbi:hypothetical protein [Streptomyces sp. NPDC012888]|uniref:hypothetical protein n=1 Tax=Streptomyces sp. NPDC012888 TaxID=3364855 RepID=UPI00369EAB63